MWKYRDLRKHEVEGTEQWEFLTSSGLAGPLTQIKVGLVIVCVCVCVCVHVCQCVCDTVSCAYLYSGVLSRIS